MFPLSADTAVELKEKYEEIEGELLENIHGIPVYMESAIDKSLVRGNVSGIIYHPFKKVSNTLSSVKSLCDIIPLHLNIKSCTYEYKNNQCRLTFYAGRKFYQKPDDVRRLNYNLKIKELSRDYLLFTLSDKNEPVDSGKPNISIAAIPLTDNSTYFYLSYEYDFGFFKHLAMSAYLSTLGYKKIGFSIIGSDEENNPIYVGGIQGVIERNVMRYYFAIQSYLDTLLIDEDKRFESRVNYWFDLTEKYHKQLYEMDKRDYLKYKKLEYKDQQRLQERINKGIENNVGLSFRQKCK